MTLVLLDNWNPTFDAYNRFIYEGIKLKGDDASLIGPGAKRQRKNAQREKSELNPMEIRDHFRQVMVSFPVK